MVSLPVISVSPDVYAKFNACVHCGLCLPACPTYAETQDESDSPRGRIHSMKALVDGRIGAPLTNTQPHAPKNDISDIVFEHLDRCLVCRACETACPSGVQYHDLIEAVRPQVAQAVLGRQMRSRTLEWTIKHIFPYPKRAALSMKAARLAQHLGLGKLVERMAPGAGTVAQSAKKSAHTYHAESPAFTPATKSVKHRGNVLLLRGCVGSILSTNINTACIRVLTANGFDVHILPDEPCCGAMAAHANDPDGAQTFARSLIAALERKSADFVVTPIAGCGAQLKSLDHVLADDPKFAQRAVAAVKKIRDICQFLAEVGITPPTKPLPRRITYHDPCHLAHAQKITAAPRHLLAMIPGLEILKLPESDMCCGAAGTYSMNQPEMAAKLGQRKANNIRTTGAQELITANIGCALQITRHLQESHQNIPVKHVIELLAESL